MQHHHEELRCKLAMRFGLSGQGAHLLALLVCNDCVTPKMVTDKLGKVEQKTLIFRLRRALLLHSSPAVEINSIRGVGYWVDDNTRKLLARAGCKFCKGQAPCPQCIVND